MPGTSGVTPLKKVISVRRVVQQAASPVLDSLERLPPKVIYGKEKGNFYLTY